MENLSDQNLPNSIDNLASTWLTADSADTPFKARENCKYVLSPALDLDHVYVLTFSVTHRLKSTFASNTDYRMEHVNSVNTNRLDEASDSFVLKGHHGHIQ